MPAVRGTPLQGDRSAHDMAYADLHASDIEDTALTRHLPAPAADGNYARDDSANWQVQSGIPLEDINEYTRGDIIRGGATDWEDYDAKTLRAVLIGNGTDLESRVLATADFPNPINYVAPTELTIAAGQITVTKTYHTVDTQGDDPTDDLTLINGGTEGDILVLRPANGARTVVVKHGTGNIWLIGEVDISLDDLDDHLQLIYNGGDWCSLGDGGGAGGGAGDVVGPAPATDDAIATYDGATGKLLQNSLVIIRAAGGTVLPDDADEPPLNITERSAEPTAPVTNDVYMDDGTNTVSGLPSWRRYTGAAWEDVSAVASSDSIIGPTWHADGTIVVLADIGEQWIMPSDGTIIEVMAIVGDNGSASSTIVDVHKNGTTIFTTQGNRPEIAHDDADKYDTGVPDVTSFVQYDVFTADIDQVGTDAKDLRIILVISGTLAGSGLDSTAIHDNVASEISAITEKASPVDADMVIIEDSADLNNKKMVQLGNLPGGSSGGASIIEIQVFT